MRLALLSPAVLTAACLLPMVPLSAQGSRPLANTKAAAKATATPALVGVWSGTASVPLGDSTIVVPVTYTFAAGATPAGMAVVPGQGRHRGLREPRQQAGRQVPHRAGQDGRAQAAPAL